MTEKTSREGIQPTRRALLMGAAAGAAGLAFAPSGAKAQARRSPGRFAGKIVLITGATSGIGRATARAFAREGATVVFNGRRDELGKQVQAEIRQAGGDATYVRSDVRDREQLRTFIDDVVERHDRIDIAFNNAGIAIPPGPIEAVDPDQFADIVATNINGPFWSMAHQIPHMKRAGGGVIVNTASVFGPHAADNQAAYGATRSAVIAMIDAVAKEVGEANIRVVGVAPGAVPDTDLFRFMGRPWNADERAYMASLAGLGRVGTPQDIAEVVLALASEGAGFVHGVTVPVDGQFLSA